MEGRPGTRQLGAALVCAVLGSAALAAGCGPSAKETTARRSPAAEAEWQWLQKTRATLAEQRSRLAAAGPASGAAALRKQTAALAGEFDRRLVELINADPPVQGRPPTARQRAALRMKSE